MPARIKLDIVVDRKTGKIETIVLEGPDATPLLGHKVGEVIDGSTINRPGEKLQITGGSDTSGFPILKGIHGQAKRRVLLPRGKGMKRCKKGEFLKATVRGEQISEETTQVNLVKVE